MKEQITERLKTLQAEYDFNAKTAAAAPATQATPMDPALATAAPVVTKATVTLTPDRESAQLARIQAAGGGL